MNTKAINRVERLETLMNRDGVDLKEFAYRMYSLELALENALVIIEGEYPKNDDRYEFAMRMAEKFSLDVGEMG